MASILLEHDQLVSVQVVHTGKHVEGQIYLPEVNWALCLLGIAAVAGFRSTTQIGYAFSESSHLMHDAKALLQHTADIVCTIVRCMRGSQEESHRMVRKDLMPECNTA